MHEVLFSKKEWGSPYREAPPHSLLLCYSLDIISKRYRHVASLCGDELEGAYS